MCLPGIPPSGDQETPQCCINNMATGPEKQYRQTRQTMDLQGLLIAFACCKSLGKILRAPLKIAYRPDSAMVAPGGLKTAHFVSALCSNSTRSEAVAILTILQVWRFRLRLRLENITCGLGFSHALYSGRYPYFLSPLKPCGISHGPEAH